MNTLNGEIDPTAPLPSENSALASTCIVCREKAVVVVLDLGKTAPANNFIMPEELARKSERFFPLQLGLCQNCGHVQLVDHVPPEVMFDHYLYMSSASSTLTEHLHGLARTVATKLGAGADDMVVDVGCNDGTLLEGLKLAGVGRRIGVDPAANLADSARKKGAEVVTAYFAPDVAGAIRDKHGTAAAITMTNTFPHIPNLPSLLQAVDRLLADDGVLVLEAHYLVDLMNMCAFDTIYHEHVSYWALKPMIWLFNDHGFDVFDVERLPIHHGQIRAWVCRKNKRPISNRVADTLATESALGLDRTEPYLRMAAKIQNIKSDLIAMIRDVRSRGGRVVGYGAPAKGSTLLSFFDLGPDDLDYIADRNLLKQGRLTPGSHIPVVSPDRIFADYPDLVVLFAWNFADEIAQQLSAYLEGGGRIVAPIPEVHEIGVKG